MNVAPRRPRGPGPASAWGMAPAFAVGLLLALACAQAPAQALRIYGMDSKPFSYIEGGHPAGLTVELAQQVQRRIGSSEPIEIVPWARANVVAMQEPNVLLLAIIRSPEREKRMEFVGPVFTGYVAAFAVKGRAAELLALGDGIYQLRAGARRGSIFVERARSLGYNVTDEPASSEAAARMLLNKRFDLWFDGESIVGPALELAGHAKSDVELVKRLSVEDAYFAFSKGTAAATVRAWDAALRDMKRDGSFQKIHQRWLPNNPLPLDVRAPLKTTP